MMDVVDVTPITSDYVSSSCDNVTSNQTQFVLPSVLEALSFSFFMSVCISTTVVGNVLVILSVFTYVPLKNPQNFFVVSLACADLAVAMLVMPFHVAYFLIGRWIFGAVLCNMWLTFDILTCTASILHLCAIAVDRYYAIHDPIRYALKRTRRRVLSKVAFVWLLSGIISVPPLLGWNNSSGRSLYDEKTQACQLTDEKSFVIYSACGSFFIPLCTMTFVYVKIFLATRARLRARARSTAVVRLQKSTATVTTTEGTDATVTVTLTAPTNPAATTDNKYFLLPGGRTTNRQKSKGLTIPEPELPSISGVHDDDDIVPKESIAADECTPTEENKCDESANGFNKKSGSCFYCRKKHKKRRKTAKNTCNDQLFKISEEKQRISLSKERRAARTMGIIMGAFVVCWLPFFLMYLIFPFCDWCKENTDPRAVTFIIWLGYVNSSLNPIIYTIFNIDFRRAVLNLICCRYRRAR